ncbi:hypothetical protein WR25_00967 isoform D [Diploscapter pachys]|uniref:Aquaporin n=1 Tax=Diploscapter pachys TaxID=2018661 RepID=A0A2A2JVJ3_9BILA|nr:hypothetical protein WR25_00967 isoform C [Diploscapter pachys]PAV65796.1 hypothetical protein WR25_00967 isoform D [Diploscapter pachys]
MANLPPQERLRRFGAKNVLIRNLLAELFGTFTLCFVGLSIVVQFHIGKTKFTNWLGVNIGWGFAILFSVQSTLRISGGHLNPAVSLLMWSFGHIKFTWFILYSIAQTIGAFIAAAATYFYYIDSFDHYDKGIRSVLGPTGTGVCFCSYPQEYLGVLSPYIDQIVGTGALAFFLCVVIDERNGIPKVWHPTFFSFLLIMIGCAFGMNLGYPINPARDFGPRLFSYFIYGAGVFSSPYNMYFLAPIIGPFIGALLGGWLYFLTIGMQNPPVEGIRNTDIPYIDQVK